MSSSLISCFLSSKQVNEAILNNLSESTKIVAQTRCDDIIESAKLLNIPKDNISFSSFAENVNNLNELMEYTCKLETMVETISTSLDTAVEELMDQQKMDFSLHESRIKTTSLNDLLDNIQSRQSDFGDISYSKIKKYIDSCSNLEAEIDKDHIALKEEEMQHNENKVPVMQLIRHLAVSIENIKNTKCTLQIELQDALSDDIIRKMVIDENIANLAAAADDLIVQLNTECLQLEEELNKCVYN